MYNVSIRNKYFEFIACNAFIYLFILLNNCINYVQVKYVKPEWKNMHLVIQILRFIAG